MKEAVGPRELHDRDWSGTKASDGFFNQSLRYPQFAETIALLNPRQLLDVGCGSGYLAELVQAIVPGVIMDGIDFSGPALERARPRFRSVWQANVDQGPLPAETAAYDTAVCVEVLEHLYDPAHALGEIHRCLAAGGSLVATVPNTAFWRYRMRLLGGRVPNPAQDPRHLHSYDIHLFRSLLVENGFSIQKILGHRMHLSWLATLRPELFSDVLIAVGRKV